ncbi:MAG: lipopolysaccharide heptosyltransferase I [Gammaproteobacteria bacterium]|nr:lipopolysaccharide heptosyltransferase I [Gammaproteobacteria bacterium]
MRVLLVKTSSMGDIIHTLPALTDATHAIKNIQFDWMVEESFASIPAWHPSVSKVIPVALRRWRKNIFSKETYQGLHALRSLLKNESYDLILDAQGLVKSAFLTFFAKGKRAGLDFKSARESYASFAYQEKYPVNFYQHAVIRMRNLFSLALNYPLKNTLPQFGITPTTTHREKNPYLVFLHGTTWESKQWPEAYWIQLASLAQSANFHIKISGGNDEEVARAKRIARNIENVEVLPYVKIPQMFTILSGAQAVITVDTGFGHLAAALNIPTVSLYGSTNPIYTGALGNHSHQLAAQFPCAPCINRQCHFKGTRDVAPACFETIKPALVWQTLQAYL